ncbi:MAG: hypothetical protein WC531_02890 [Candidatus Paceibacterota bacterium]|jgi:hypothetical protein
MDEETKKLLKEEFELNKENNQLLNKLVSYQRWARWLNVTKWVIVIATTLGALYYLPLMLTGLTSYYTEALDAISNTSVQILPGQ